MQHLGETILLISYLGTGALNWGLYGLGLFVGRKRLSLLDRRVPPLEKPPRVSILMPAKNEGPRVAEGIRSALSQDYPDFEVIAIDDRSTDETGRVMDDLAAADPRLRVNHITENPPPGWTGKCNALHQSVHKATGDWLLFVDSDVILQPTVLHKVIEHAVGRQYGMLSLILDLERHSFWESLVTPLASSAIMGLYQVPESNQDRKKNNAFANGQFILIDRKVYESVGGHAAVRDKFSEDVELAKVVKSAGHRPRTALGSDFATVRMYSSLQTVLRGWARNFFGMGGGKRGMIVVGMIYTLLAGFSLYPAIAWAIYRWNHPADAYLTYGWPIAAVLHFVLMTIFLGILYAWSSVKWWFALLFPLGGAMLMAIFVKALILCKTRQVSWRGDTYAQPAASAAK